MERMLHSLFKGNKMLREREGKERGSEVIGDWSELSINLKSPIITDRQFVGQTLTLIE